MQRSLCILLSFSLLLFFPLLFTACGSGNAPTFRVMDADGRALDTADLVGRPMVINFWATWCPPCVGELPHFEEAYQAMGEDVLFLMVNVDGQGVKDIATAGAFAAERGYTFPLYFDLTGEASRAYGVTAIPTTVWIDRRGDLFTTYTGALDQDTLNHYTAACCAA